MKSLTKWGPRKMWSHRLPLVTIAKIEVLQAKMPHDNGKPPSQADVVAEAVEAYSLAQDKDQKEPT